MQITERSRERALLKAQCAKVRLSLTDQLANAVVWVGSVAFGLWLLAIVLRALFHYWAWGTI